MVSGVFSWSIISLRINHYISLPLGPSLQREPVLTDEWWGTCCFWMSASCRKITNPGWDRGNFWCVVSQITLFNQLSEWEVKWFERSCGRKLPSVVFCFDQNPNSSWCQSLFPCLTLYVQRNKVPCHPCPKSPQRCPGRILLKGDNICLMMNTGAWSEMEKSRLMSLIAGHLLNDGKMPSPMPSPIFFGTGVMWSHVKPDRIMPNGWCRARNIADAARNAAMRSHYGRGCPKITRSNLFDGELNCSDWSRQELASEKTKEDSSN